MEKFFYLLSNSNQVQFLLMAIPRLLVATILCGIIGMEREHVNRPAGVRTHVLVGVSAALIMITSEYLFSYYEELTNMDPARMGAQIISGIGFLGAGTIIKDGLNVRGLTTAASLWAVACIGIASGAGFYSGALLATIAIYLTLEVLKKYMMKRSYYKIILIQVVNLDDVLEQVRYELEKSHIYINHIEVFTSKENVYKEIKLHVSVSSGKAMLDTAMRNIREMDSVLSIDVE
ncbi:MAG: MgtC/SapB family protein [Lachnospiraceae bacterium]|nr:MgtC/SapB family protein [Lachnospiraceae bacterium]